MTGCRDRRPSRKNWRLYHLLDLDQPTTARQVKWTFRKCTLRHHYYQAYLALYNKHRKHLYDVVGEEAYGFIDHGTWGPLIPHLGAVATVVVYCVGMLIEVGLLILFFALLAARVDGALSSLAWMRVAAPLMAFVLLMWLVTAAALVTNWASARTYREGMALVDRLSPLGNFVAASLYVCLPFVLATAVREGGEAHVGRYTGYLALAITADIIYYLTSLIWRWPRRTQRLMHVDSTHLHNGQHMDGIGASGGKRRGGSYVPYYSHTARRWISYGIFAAAFANMGCAIAQWVCIGRKLDRHLTHSWYVVFIPFCFRAGVRVIEALLRSLQRRAMGVRSVAHVVFDVLGSFFTNGLLLTGLYLVAVRLQRGAPAPRMGYALIPVYLVLAYIFLALLVTLVYLVAKVRARARHERRRNAAWVPPAEPAEVLTSSNNSYGAHVHADGGAGNMIVVADPGMMAAQQQQQQQQQQQRALLQVADKDVNNDSGSGGSGGGRPLRDLITPSSEVFDNLVTSQQPPQRRRQQQQPQTQMSSTSQPYDEHEYGQPVYSEAAGAESRAAARDTVVVLPQPLPLSDAAEHDLHTLHSNTGQVRSQHSSSSRRLAQSQRPVSRRGGDVAAAGGARHRDPYAAVAAHDGGGGAVPRRATAPQSVEDSSDYTEEQMSYEEDDDGDEDDGSYEYEYDEEDDASHRDRSASSYDDDDAYDDEEEETDEEETARSEDDASYTYDDDDDDVSSYDEAVEDTRSGSRSNNASERRRAQQRQQRGATSAATAAVSAPLSSPAFSSSPTQSSARASRRRQRP